MYEFLDEISPFVDLISLIAVLIIIFSGEKSKRDKFNLWPFFYRLVPCTFLWLALSGSLRYVNMAKGLKSIVCGICVVTVAVLIRNKDKNSQA